MTKTLKFFAALLVAFPVLVQAQRTYSQPELDQMLAPVALYPDALLSQVLMAATYPLEVVEAARWTRANSGLQGDDAVRAVQDEDWDPSVKSLVAFPQVLQRMDEQLDWTESLGDAFLAQENHVMDTVQQLRRRAQAAGNLQSNEQMQVQQQGQTIVLQPAAPQVVYVPYYDPYVVYGPWWWPAYRPVYWAPWPGYARPYHPGVSVGFWWGQPVGLSLNFFFGNFDWHHRHVRVAHPTAYYYRPPVVVVNRTVVVDRSRWQHDPHHRRHVAYRAPEVRQRFVSAQIERRDVQREERRDAQPQPQTRTQTRPAAPQQTQRVTPPQAQPVAQPQTQRDQSRQQAEAVRAQQQLQREQAEASRARQRQQAEAARFQQQQQRQEQRAAMPAAKAPQTPRAERQERLEQRHERGQKG